MLHYLSGAGGAELSGGWISFRELQSGAIYIGLPETGRHTTNQRFRHPARGFGPSRRTPGRQKAAYGDLSYIIPVLPRVPLLVILWYGDDEFPPNANILFNRHANAYLSTEDCAQLAGQTVYTMLKFKAE